MNSCISTKVEFQRLLSSHINFGLLYYNYIIVYYTYYVEVLKPRY